VVIQLKQENIVIFSSRVHQCAWCDTE